MLRYLLVCCGLLWALGNLSAAEEESPLDALWKGEPFSAQPQDILRELAKVPPKVDQDPDVLLEEWRIRIDEKGCAQRTLRRVMRFGTREGAEAWGVVSAPWAPWYQIKPTIKARVITPDGQTHELDPKSIAEAAPQDQGDGVLTDRKLVQAPLPAMAAGVVVEEVMTMTDSQPFFAAGTLHRANLLNFFPIRRISAVIRVPALLAHHCGAIGDGVKIEKEEKDGWIEYSVSADGSDGLTKVEPFMPTELPRIPAIMFTTGKSWEDVARSYSDTVEKQIKSQRVEALVHKVLTGKETRSEAAGKLLAHVQQFVRYTSLAFGESAIVPHVPDETLTRRYGDCKDQSILLAAMLRAAGFKAHVALLKVGERQDVARDYPALNAFDHAIVYMPGDTPLWLDPTTSFVPVGELPIPDQGRLALIASAETKDLQLTPRTSSTANVSLYQGEYRLGNAGQGSVVEHEELSGFFGTERRRQFAAARREVLKQAYDRNAQQYQVREIKKFDYSDPYDFSKPFRIDVEIEKCQAGIVAQDDAAINVLDCSTIFNRLPPALFPAPAPATPPGGQAAPSTAAEGPRKTTCVLVEPYRAELDYRLIPPPGYTPHELPSKIQKQWGPASLNVSFEAEGGAVRARFKFDTGSGVFSPAEFTALRSGIDELALEGSLSNWTYTIKFVHRARQFAKEGKWKECFAEYQKSLTAAPKNAVLRSLYAVSLNESGLRDAAIDEARRAAADAPANAPVFSNLGLILASDETGRPYRRGMKMDEAAAAWRKAMELDPKNQDYPYFLGILQEFDEAGFRYGDSKKLQEAIKTYEFARSLGASPTIINNNLCFALLHAGEHAKAQEVSTHLAPAENELPLKLACAALTKSPAAAISLAGNLPLSVEVRQQRLLAAAGILENIGQYRPAADLLEYLLPKPIDPRGKQSLETLRKLKSQAEFQLAPDNPAYPVQQLLFVLAKSGPQPELLRPLAATAQTYSPVVEAEDPFWMEDRIRILQRQSAIRRRIDAISLFAFQTEGDETLGYKVAVRAGTPAMFQCYVVKTDAGYKILFPGRGYAEFGKLALAKIEAGELAAAEKWLSRARSEIPVGAALFDPFGSPPFVRLFATADKKNADDLKLAAAALASTDLDNCRAIEILEQAKPATGLAELQVQRALAQAYSFAKRDQDLLKLAEKILLQSPNATEPLSYRIAALLELGKTAEASAAADEWRKKQSGSWVAQERYAHVLASENKFSDAQSILRSAIDKEKSLPSRVLNTAAWNALFLDKLPPEAVEDARRGCEASYQQEDMVLHTYSCVLAEAGQTQEALANLQRAIDVRSPPLLQVEDNLVLGRLAEQYGLPGIARAYYRKIPPNDRSLGGSDDLARRRLKRLEDATVDKAQQSK